jgi:polysaccharide biosynthesis transport protein
VNTKAASTHLSDPPALTLDFSHFFHLLLAKAWVIIVFLVLSLCAAIAYLIWTPKIYESRAVIEVDQATPKVNNVQDFNPGNDTNLPEVLKTIEQTLLSETLLLRVVKTNALDKDPLFAPPKKDGSPYLDSELAARFKSRVKVALRRGTQLIDVTVEDRDPKRAQQLAQSMVKEFVGQSFKERPGVSEASNDYLREEGGVKVKLQSAEQAVQKYREDHNAVSLEDKKNIIVEKLKELNRKVTETKSERLKLEADVATIKQGKVKTPEELLLPTVATLPVVANLRQELADKRSKFKAESQTRGPQQALDQTLLHVASMVIKSYEAAKTTEAKLNVECIPPPA